MVSGFLPEALKRLRLCPQPRPGEHEYDRERRNKNKRGGEQSLIIIPRISIVQVYGEGAHHPEVAFIS